MFKLYRRILDNPRYPEQNGRLYSIETFGTWHEGEESWWRSPTLDTVRQSAENCRRFYADVGVKVEHVIGIVLGTTMECILV